MYYYFFFFLVLRCDFGFLDFGFLDFGFLDLRFLDFGFLDFFLDRRLFPLEPPKSRALGCGVAAW